MNGGKAVGYSLPMDEAIRAGSLPPAPVWRRIGAPALWWIASTLVAWVVLVGVDVRLRSPLPGWRIWPYAVETGLRLALGSLPLVGALYLAARRLGPRRWIAGPIVAALAVPFLHPMAGELSRGEGVVASRSLVLYGALATLAAAVGLICSWHLLAVRAALGGDPRPRAWRRAFPLAVAAGAGLFWATSFELGAYAFLHGVTVPLMLLVAITAVFTLLARHRRGSAAALAVVALAVAVAGAGRLARPPALEGRPYIVPRSPIAAQVDAWLWSVADVVRFDFAHPERFRCHEPLPRIWPPAPGPTDRPRHVVLLSIDALRSDMLEGRRGRPVMPHLEPFARESIFAARATTTYPATVFAVGSALTGLPASRILFAPKPPPSVLSLASRRVDDVFAALPSVHWFSQPTVRSLFLQGAPSGRFENATEQTDAALARIRSARVAGRSSFVWVHYYEPHQPYEAHPGFAFGDSLPDLYRSEAAFVDRQISRLLDEYRQGWYADTLLVVFSDHGEALGEGRFWGHHVHLDRWIADVPVVVRAPGLVGRSVGSVVELTDVAATIAHFLDLPLYSSASGHSLLSGDPPPERVAVSEAFPARGHELFRLAGRPIRSPRALMAAAARMQRELRRYAPKVSLVDGRYRLIVDRESGISRLYDRRSDPPESRDLVEDRPEVVASMTRRLVRWHEQTSEQIYCAVVGQAGDRAAGEPPR